ncbi:MAG: Lrp/AsnC family transcriptional regulator [Paracoccaceae bacterium]
MRLDAIDLKILDAVQRDGRITKLRLAEVAGLSPTPVWVRLRRLEQSGLIAGYHARLAPRKVTPFAAIIMEVMLGNHRQADFDRFERAVTKVPQVVAVWSVGGKVDYFLKILSADIESYQTLVDQWLAADIGIDRYFTYVVTRTVKEDQDFPLALLRL